MGFFKKAVRSPKSERRSASVDIYGGDELLEVKGEASYQAELEAIAGPRTERGKDFPVDAVLIREPENEYDSNAIAVYATRRDGTLGAQKVGYVNRVSAEAMTPAIDRKNRLGETIGLEGRIVGGWDGGDGDTGLFGIWLKYDPNDFQES